MKPARISPKEIRGANGKFLPKPLLFHLRHPNSKTNQPKFWQILSPKNSFAKTSSALFRHLPEYLEGRTPKRKMSFPFSEKIGRAQIRKARNIFSFWGCRVKRGSGGTIRAYDLVSSHHALRAWHIICFENRFELGTINTPRVSTRTSVLPEQAVSTACVRNRTPESCFSSTQNRRGGAQTNLCDGKGLVEGDTPAEPPPKQKPPSRAVFVFFSFTLFS